MRGASVTWLPERGYFLASTIQHVLEHVHGHDITDTVRLKIEAFRMPPTRSVPGPDLRSALRRPLIRWRPHPRLRRLIMTKTLR